MKSIVIRRTRGRFYTISLTNPLTAVNLVIHLYMALILHFCDNHHKKVAINFTLFNQIFLFSAGIAAGK